MARTTLRFECLESKKLMAADVLGADDAVVVEAADAGSADTAEIDLVELAGGDDGADQPICYLKYKLERTFIKSWSTSGDADDQPAEDDITGIDAAFASTEPV